jgi:type I restriction enzyme S subunit
MKAGWQTKKLGEVCIVDKRQGNNKDLPYVGLEHIESQTGRFIGSPEPVGVKSTTFKFSTEHLLYGRLRPYLNKVMLPNFIGHCSTEIFPLKPRPELLREFLQYWFLMDATVEQIDATSTGARMPRANMNAVLNFKFPLPPLPEQQRIVHILDQAFAGIATAKTNTEKNLQNARALFESYLDEVFSQRGGGWEEKRLDEVYDVRDGTHDSPKFQKFGYAFVTSKNLKNSLLNFDKIQFISEEDYNNYNKRSKVDKGDILFAMIGTLGNPVIVEIEPNFAIKNVALIKVPNTQSNYFLNYYLGSKSIVDKIYNDAKGTTQKFMGLGNLRKLIIFLPSLTEQRAIVAKLDTLHGETQRLASLYQCKLAALDELKKSLLHQAFNGEL